MVNLKDYYGEEGCCLTCEDAEPDCLCYKCKCRKCTYYDEVNENCDLAWTWKDYEDQAEHVKREALKFYGTDLINVKATFSNGSISHTVHYTNVSDVPTKITYHLSEGYPYKTRTLLLEKIEPCEECGRKLEKQLEVKT